MRRSAAGTQPKPTTIGTPRARASMATWLVGLPAVSAMPPCAAIHCRGSARARDRRRRGSRPRVIRAPLRRLPRAPCRPGRRRSRRSTARARKIGVGGGGVVGDLGVERTSQARSAGDRRVNFAVGGAVKILILEQRELEFENIRRLARLRLPRAPPGRRRLWR